MGAGITGRHSRGRNDRMWARSRVVMRCSSLRQVHRKDHGIWGKDDKFCLDMWFKLSVGH